MTNFFNLDFHELTLVIPSQRTISDDGLDRTIITIMISMKVECELWAISSQRFRRELWQNRREPGSRAEPNICEIDFDSELAPWGSISSSCPSAQLAKVHQILEY
jgi:hypothetical protein